MLTKPVKPSQLHDALVTALAGPAGVTPIRPARDSTGIDGTLGERHPLRILVAEDNPVNQKVAVRVLERMGYQANVAANGIEAVGAVESTVYDVVLMDVQMPEDREACHAAGMDGYLSKPIRVDELARALEDVPRRPTSVVS